MPSFINSWDDFTRPSLFSLSLSWRKFKSKIVKSLSWIEIYSSVGREKISSKNNPSTNLSNIIIVGKDKTRELFSQRFENSSKSLSWLLKERKQKVLVGKIFLQLLLFLLKRTIWLYTIAFVIHCNYNSVRLLWKFFLSSLK